MRGQRSTPSQGPSIPSVVHLIGLLLIGLLLFQPRALHAQEATRLDVYTLMTGRLEEIEERIHAGVAGGTVPRDEDSLVYELSLIQETAGEYRDLAAKASMLLFLITEQQHARDRAAGITEAIAQETESRGEGAGYRFGVGVGIGIGVATAGAFGTFRYLSDEYYSRYVNSTTENQGAINAYYYRLFDIFGIAAVATSAVGFTFASLLIALDPHSLPLRPYSRVRPVRTLSAYGPDEKRVLLLNERMRLLEEIESERRRVKAANVSLGISATLGIASAGTAVAGAILTNRMDLKAANTASAEESEDLRRRTKLWRNITIGTGAGGGACALIAFISAIARPDPEVTVRTIELIDAQLEMLREEIR